MAYTSENNTKNIIGDVLKKKEFYKYKINRTEDAKNNYNNLFTQITDLTDAISENNILQYNSYQLFISKYINPNTPYSRILMKWSTGSGKSIGSLGIAMNFIKYFKQEFTEELNSPGTVFIIGFTATSIFKPELLSFPEFGIINKEELKKLKKLKKLANGDIAYYKELYKEFLTKLKKNITNRQKNGFFEFIGYKKLVNMLFIINDIKIDLSNLTEEQIIDHINNNKITLNIDLLNKFKNSLIICDEIHNVYNSVHKNNWGIALQYILNYDESIRAVFMSATPINNKPSEIIDLLNLLLPSKYYKKLDKKEYFDKNNQLKNNAINKIAELCKGRISYVKDINPINYPSKLMIGDVIDNIDYLKFIRCPMSKFHYDTYKRNFTGTLSIDSNYLVDFALPNPNNSEDGIFQSSKILTLSNADQKWKDLHKIDFKNNKIIGPILQKENLKKISTKYYNMMESIIDIIKNKKGKTFIYHNYIHMSGVLFISEILLNNDIISENGNSSDNTICVICGKRKKEHIVPDQPNILGGMSNNNKLYDAKKKINTLEKDNTKECFINNMEESLCIDSDQNKKIINNINKLIKISFNNTFKIIFNENTCLYNIIKNNKEILEFIIFNDIININLCFIQLININIDVLNVLIDNFKCIIKINKRDVLNKQIKKITNQKNVNICKYKTDNNIYITGIKELVNKNICSNYITKFNIFYNTSIKNIKKDNGSKYINGKSGGGDNIHTFMPVKFITVHSEIDKSNIYSMLGRFNSIDNTNGNRIMILIGGKIMKESYDIKAVRELLVMGRPDNIPTLIQIMGRCIRKHSHKHVEDGKKNVNIRIFTTCLPIKDSRNKYKLSIEEEKYKDKINEYKVIQIIEKVLHENAVDSFINNDIIKYNKIKSNTLDDLPFSPNINNLPKIKFQDKKLYNIDIHNLDDVGYNIYYYEEEINNIKYLIKRFFIEISTVWSYNDLFIAVKNANNYFNIEFNSNIISEKFYNMALSFLIFIENNLYTEPIFNNKLEKDVSDELMINYLFNSDKKIIYYNNIQYIITIKNDYLILLPYNKLLNAPDNLIEIPYRTVKKDDDIKININNFLHANANISTYTEKKERFYGRWANVSINDLELAVCDFGMDFHIKFIEEVISYIFNVWTSNTIKKHNMHNFYFKMLNYYNLRKIILWGNNLKEDTFKKYSKYMYMVDIKLKNPKTKKDQADLNIKEFRQKNKNLSSSGMLNMLKSSINQSNNKWASTGMRTTFDINLEKSLDLFNGIYKKRLSSNIQEKIDSSLIPVGHFLTKPPRFYIPELNWYDNPEYLNHEIKFKENNIIIGYDERSSTGIHIRFKLRNSINNIKQFKDNRLIEKGAVCSTKSKMYLKDIAIKIGIKFTKTKFNVEILCADIRTRLIYLELKERIAKTNIKWFYFIYETRPDIIE